MGGFGFGCGRFFQLWVGIFFHGFFLDWVGDSMRAGRGVGGRTREGGRTARKQLSPLSHPPLLLFQRETHTFKHSPLDSIDLQFSTLASDILTLSHLNLISHITSSLAFPLQSSPSNSTLRSCLQMFFSLNL